MKGCCKKLSMKNLIFWLLAILAIVYFLSSIRCKTFDEFEKNNVPHTPASYNNEKVRIIKNEYALVKFWGTQDATPCGLCNDDFKTYVTWKIKELEIIGEPEYFQKKPLVGKKCIKEAIIYLYM